MSLLISLVAASAMMADDPIFDLARRGDVDGVSSRLRSVPALAYRPDARGNFAIQHAAAGNKVAVTKLLLSSGAKIDQRSSSMGTPLQIASERNFYDLALELLSRGANSGAQGGRGQTALHYAVRANSEGITRLLATSGAELYLTDRDWLNPVQINVGNNEAQRWLRGFERSTREPYESIQPIASEEASCPKKAFVWSGSDVVPLQFQTGDQWGRSGHLEVAEAPSGQRLLGPFGRQAISLSLTELSTHRHVRIAVRFAVIGSWDGNGGVGSGPDVLDFRVRGHGGILHSTFFNNNEEGRERLTMQSFPDWYPLRFHKGYEGASEVRSLGYRERWMDRSYARDAIYKIERTFAHSDKHLRLDMSSLTVGEASNGPFDEDERWAICGIQVTTD